MFSYTINNPNNLVINNNNFHAIPIGYRCSTAIACKYAKIRNFSLPFDWGIPWNPTKIQTILENDFQNFCNFESINNSNIMYNKTYDFQSGHFTNENNVLNETFHRRIDRFNNIMNESTKKYFIHINEDFIYSTYHKTYEFCNNIFNELLEFEDFIKKKYTNIEYNILYFDFNKHNIPKNSNIINIVLNSNVIYNTVHESPYEEFRMYCGQILSELFYTNVLKEDIIIYNENIFNE